MNDEAHPIYTVGTLTAELKKLPENMPIMVTVVKYPHQFGEPGHPIYKDGRWDTGTDTEVHALDELHIVEGMVYLTVELNDWDNDRILLKEAEG